MLLLATTLYVGVLLVAWLSAFSHLVIFPEVFSCPGIVLGAKDTAGSNHTNTPTLL